MGPFKVSIEEKWNKFLLHVSICDDYSCDAWLYIFLHSKSISLISSEFRKGFYLKGIGILKVCANFYFK